MIEKSIGELVEIYPYINVYLGDFEIDFDNEKSFEDNLKKQPEYFFQQRKMTLEETVDEFESYLKKASSILEENVEIVHKISIFPGKSKDGTPENFKEITVNKGEVIAIVGETGSGKSRLLEDIEWQAERDTPTNRMVVINDLTKKERQRLSGRQRIIAQLSQNMNFVLDMNVGEFLTMHAECFVKKTKVQPLVEKVYEEAINLAGEDFGLDTSITSLSGGQSRALMIADCAYISKAPIVLIDEIENAGIDRKKALKLLVGNEKIVFIATHDPVLALSADKRIVIKNGAINSIIEKNAKEQKALEAAEEMDRKLLQLRDRIREGEIISKFQVL